MRKQKKRPKCTFGQVFSRFMQRSGLTQYEVAERAGVKQPVIAWFIQCRKLPSVSRSKVSEKGGQPRAVTAKLAEALGLSPKEKKELYRARLIIDEKNPIWEPEIIDLLPKVPSISQEEAIELFQKGLKGEKLTTWAIKKGFFDASVQKIFDFLRGKPGKTVEVSSTRRSVLPQVIKSLSLTPREKATLARYFFEKLLDPDIVETLTSES